TCMSVEFSGGRVSQEATLMMKAIEDIGGVTKLTETELARFGATLNEAVPKMDAMGINVPDKMREMAKETAGEGKEVGLLGTITSQVGGMIAAAFSVQAIINFTLEAVHATAAISKMALTSGRETDYVQ